VCSSDLAAVKYKFHCMTFVFQNIVSPRFYVGDEFVSIAVLDRAFLALECMAEADRSVSLKELAGSTRIPKPTLFRILRTLTALGYVDQDRSRSHYQLTVQLAHLGRGRAFDELKERALPLMESLHQKFNETVNLGVLQGTYVYYLHVIETTRNLRWQVHPGSRDAFFCTALGRAIVAQLPAEQQLHLLKRVVLKRRTSGTIIDRERLLGILARTRQRYWALDNQENDEGVMCFGIPLLDEGHPIASVSVSVPITRVSARRQREIIAALLAHSLADKAPGSRQRKRTSR